jgi:hypothetical protein
MHQGHLGPVVRSDRSRIQAVLHRPDQVGWQSWTTLEAKSAGQVSRFWNAVISLPCALSAAKNRLRWLWSIAQRVSGPEGVRATRRRGPR